MNVHIKSLCQLARLHEQDDAMTTETPFENSRSKVLKQVRSLHIQRNLLQANKSTERFIGHQCPDTEDPCGRVLRRLRSQQGLDASVVASKACISVRQLYELETGKDSLFYTAGLRHKAAQRVAEFLGSNWSDILQGLVAVGPVISPKAHVHVLKTPLTKMCLSDAQTMRQPTPNPLHAADTSSDRAPFSSAHFLRIHEGERATPSAN